MQAVLNPDDVVLLDRNCHKSVHYGIALCDAIPVYLEPSLNTKYALMGPVPKSTIEKEILRLEKVRKPAKLLVLTNCTYDGMVYDMPAIVKLAHDHHVKVLVDEAWFGYAYFCESLRNYSAMFCGADYATQSTHKVLSAFSQASMIHVRDRYFDDEDKQLEHRFTESFMMHTSTSPQYTMIASLDCARLQMYLQGDMLMEEVQNTAQFLRQEINRLKCFRVLSDSELIPGEVFGDGVVLDSSKLTISFDGSGYSRKDLLAELSSRHIEIEKSSFNTLTVLVTPGIALASGKPGRLLDVLRRLSSNPGGYRDTPPDPFPTRIVQPRYRPRDVMVANVVWVPLDKIPTTGAISAAMIVPYPPGIPVVLPGQVWDQDAASCVQGLVQREVEVHGLNRRHEVPILADADRQCRVIPSEVLSDE
jgi:arginine decarboxylase